MIPHQAFVPLLLAGCFPLLGAEGPSELTIPAPGSAVELFHPNGLPSWAEPAAPTAVPESRPEPRAGGPPTLPRPSGSDDLFEAPTWAGIRHGDRERRKLKNSTEYDWGFSATEVIWRAPEPGYESPFERGEWSTEDLFAVPLSGPVYLFGEVTMLGEYSADQAMRVVGKTGVLWRVPVGEGAPVEVRGGPAVKYNDALRVDRSGEQGSVLWEVKAKAPLVGPIGLEYIGEALPGTTPEDRSQLKQDLSLFLPVSGGKLKLGAKHRWDGTEETRAADGFMQVYLGIEIGR
jgi:hypothetical protein